jgi:hypothetical protein
MIKEFRIDMLREIESISETLMYSP